MSILSQLFEGKISLVSALNQGQQWFDALLAKAPPNVQAGVESGVQDFQQAAANAVALADTALGPIAATATAAINAAANAALVAATGGVAAPLTPVVDAGIDALINAGHAELDALAAQFRANLVSPVVKPTPPAMGVAPVQAATPHPG